MKLPDPHDVSNPSLPLPGFFHLMTRYGEQIDNLPPDDIGLHDIIDKIDVGLQRIMGGSCNGKVNYRSCDDPYALTAECAKITGIK